MSLKSRAQKVVSPVLGRYTEIEIRQGKGVYLICQHGNRFLDFSSGIAVTNTGHCHPKVVEAIRKQAGELIHACIGIGNYKGYIELCEKLKEITPGNLEVSFLCQSGTEAVEAALKLAKHASGKPGIMAFQGGFHGRTLGSLSVTTSKEKIRTPYEPLLPNVYIAPYAYCYRCSSTPPACGFECLKETEKIIKKAGNHKIGGMIVEPVQGENGYIVPPKEFLTGLRKLCNKYKILLIADEIQTGFGRTGKMFALEHFGIVPDILCLSKAIASGMPLGAIIAKKEIMNKWPTGAHGGTLGGNPVCCAAALASLEVIKGEKLVEQSAKLGRYLKSKLEKIKGKYRDIGDVRGLGLMVGVEFTDPGIVPQVLKYCLDHNLILISAGKDNQTIRFVPPLIVSRSQIDVSAVIFEGALKSILK